MTNNAIDPRNFPVVADGKDVKTPDGKSIAKAKNGEVAQEIADCLNEVDQRKEEDKWSA